MHGFLVREDSLISKNENLKKNSIDLCSSLKKKPISLSNKIKKWHGGGCR